MVSKNLVQRATVVAVCVLLVLADVASAAPSINDLETMKELYDLLMSERFGHQLVRKAGRDPSVRLRFGRRADPSWPVYPSEGSAENATN